jgi:hypothetical protein
LRAVLLHELAHFRSLDVPLHWAFTLMRIVHWFNPVSHLATREWLKFREEAADEAAIELLPERDAKTYGETLVETLRHRFDFPLPAGALAIGESHKNLKQRIAMIMNHPRKSAHRAFTLFFTLTLGLVAVLRPAHAEAIAPPAATKAIESWVDVIDAGNYGVSWDQASKSFQKEVTKEQWVTAAVTVRAPLGAKKQRTLASAKIVEELPGPKGPIKGEFVIATYDTTYETPGSFVETLTFEKEADGVWRASGYFIRPAK